MKKILTISAVIFIFAVSSLFAQKGIDNQTQEIKTEGKKTTQTSQPSRDTSTVYDFGKGKTKVRSRLSNPYKLNSRRDILINSIVDILKDKQVIIDESASKFKEGLIVSQPYIFAKGPVTSRNELNRYAILPDTATPWTRGRYTYTIEVQSIDGIQNNVYVTAKVEGRSGNGLFTEWNTLDSSGQAEEELLIQLVQMITGISPDAPTIENP